MRPIKVSVCVLALLVTASSAWAYRCSGYADSRYVWCDDYDQYCDAKDPNFPWPGYPGDPELSACPGGDTLPDENFFRRSYHWPKDPTARSSEGPVTWYKIHELSGGSGHDGNEYYDCVGTCAGGPNDGLPCAKDNECSNLSTPFLLNYQGGSNSAQYHKWNLATTIAARHEGFNAINGTDDSPLILRWYQTGGYSAWAENAPAYFELALGDDRADTNYILFGGGPAEDNCGIYHDCTCANLHSDATCTTGTCTMPLCVGACAYYECNGTCPLESPKNPGGSCTVDSDCSQCVGGDRDGDTCSYLGDPLCRACDASPYASCSNDAQCGGGTCTTGLRIGNACTSDLTCSKCVGGAAGEAATCTSDYACQHQCAAEEHAVCEGEDSPNYNVECHDDAFCTGGHYYPIVCQNNLYVADCPPQSTTIHKAIAYGWLAQQDTNPCNLDTGRKPSLSHPATFDGVKWWNIRAGMWVGNGDYDNPPWGTWMELTIKTGTYDIRMEGSAHDSPQWKTGIVRQYTGPFDKIAYGTGPGCELNPDGSCKAAPAAWDYANNESGWGWQNMYADSAVLLDGDYVSLSGACCHENGDCNTVPESSCGGTHDRFAGIDTTCTDEGYKCCPYPFADADKDGDVDQMDFAAFQLCYTGSGGGVPEGCDCFNRDADTNIDADDFTEFNDCWTGPNVKYVDVVPPPTNCNP